MVDGRNPDDATYINSNWGVLATGFSASSQQNGSYPYASGDQEAVLDTMRTQDSAKLLAIYSNLFSDLIAVLQQPAPAPQNRITTATVKSIVDEVQSLEGLRALLRELTIIGYERTLSRDDVLSGLLFGSDSLQGVADLRVSTALCYQGQTSKAADSCLAEFAMRPSVRAQSLAQRLSLVNASISSGKLSDSHRLIEATLDRLGVARCVVPQTYNGKADCNAQH